MDQLAAAMVRDTAHSAGDGENITELRVYLCRPQSVKNNDAYKQVCVCVCVCSRSA